METGGIINIPMRSPSTKTAKTRKKDPNKISEVLLADRLGLGEEWIEKTEDNAGNWVEDSLAPDDLPQFIRSEHTPAEIMEVKRAVQRLVAAGCRQSVLYLCLEELSPEAEAIRAARRRVSVLGKDDEYDLLPEREEQRRYALGEDLEAVSNKATDTRQLIRRYRRELLLSADTKKSPLPPGIISVTSDADEALSMVTELLTWVASLAEEYTTPHETTLLKSKDLLYLIAYVVKYADADRIHGQARGEDDALSDLATRVTGKPWSSSDLREKLHNFEKDHKPLYKRLMRKVDAAHRFHATP